MLKISNFYGTPSSVIVNLADSQQKLQIFFDEYTGNPYSRNKVDTVLLKWVEHAGIYLGADNSGRGWFAHNHIEAGTVVLSTIEEFSKNQQLFSYDVECFKSPIQVVDNILMQAVEQKIYDWKDYNCQTAVNLACNNTPVSKDADTVKTVLTGVAGVALLGIGLVALKAILK